MPVPVFQTTPKRKGCTTVAHISDLHVRMDTDYASRIWAALREDLESQKDRVDLVVATGDLIDNPLASLNRAAAVTAFNSVRTYLRGVCEGIALDPLAGLCVVAGNHDYRQQGLVWRKANPASFETVFRDHLGHRLYPDLRLACFSFDSNSDDSHLNFAAGLVKSERLIEFAREVESLQKRPDWAELTKLALLHHHPMPIGPTEHRDSLAGRAEHMLLKNAGLFLREMVKARIDFILHGHQHYSAMSKACYPLESHDFHTVTVLAGGSVGPGKPPSYYLLTFTETGEVEVEERTLKEATYERAALRKLVTYSRARLKRIDPLTRKIGAAVRIGHYARIDQIAAGSGDDFIAERVVDLIALDQPVSVLHHTTTSRSGIPSTRQYTSLTPGQSIKWVWLANRSEDGRRHAETRFDPPVAKHEPISFERTGKIFNAIHFNARDRLDTTDEAQDSEYVRSYVGQVYDAMTLQVLFPKGHWPASFRVEVWDTEKAIDRLETEHASARLSIIGVMRSVSLSVEQPLPGYSYSIVWDLPRDEQDEISLTAAQSGMATEIVSRLLQVRRRPQVQSCLEDLVNEIRDAFDSTTSDRTLEAGVLCYDRSARGLVSVASVGHVTSGGNLEAWVVKPGRGIEGQAFRRREVIVYVGTLAQGASDTGFYEDLPDSTEPPHTLVIAIPVFYPITPKKGRRVAVVRICTRSNTSGLLRLEDHAGAGARALTEHTLAWFARHIGTSLGLGTLTE